MPFFSVFVEGLPAVTDPGAGDAIPLVRAGTDYSVDPSLFTGGGGAGAATWYGPVVCLESGTVNGEPAPLGDNGYMESVALWTPAVGDLILNAVVYTTVGWDAPFLRFGMYRDADDTQWEYISFPVGAGKESIDNGGFWEQPNDDPNGATNALTESVLGNSTYGGKTGFIARITDAGEPWTVWWVPQGGASPGVSHVYFQVCTPTPVT